MRARGITGLFGALAAVGLLGGRPAAIAHATPCRPAGAKACDRDPAAGALFVTGRPGARPH